MKRLLYIVIALLSPLLMAQSTVVCTTASPGTVIGSCAGSGFSSPVTTDPVSATGVWTFDNAANTPVTFSDGATVKAGTGTGTLSVGGVLCKGAPAQATTGTAEEVLATCTIPAATLSAAGATLRVGIFGHTAANANNKTLRVRVGGIGGTIAAQSITAASNNLNVFTITPVTIVRSGAATFNSYVNFGLLANATAGSGATAYGAYTVRAGAATWANANDLVITGTTPTAAGDLTLDSYTVEVVQ